MLQKHFCGSKCFLVCGAKKHLLRKQNLLPEKQKYFWICSEECWFLSKCFLFEHRGNISGNNVSSFAGAFTDGHHYLWLKYSVAVYFNHDCSRILCRRSRVRAFCQMWQICKSWIQKQPILCSAKYSRVNWIVVMFTILHWLCLLRVLLCNKS